VELGLAVVFAFLAIVTAIWPTWLESMTGLEPDSGTGETEWGIVAVFGLVAVIAGVLARRDYRRLARDV
jgi:hypothetical protein